jgi:rhodanese-related sulfurtransferase
MGGGEEDEDVRRKGEIARMFTAFAHKFPNAPEITAEELARDMLDNQKPLVVVDVRTKEEQDVSVIKSAIRKDDFEELKAEFADHKVGGGGLYDLNPVVTHSALKAPPGFNPFAPTKMIKVCFRSVLGVKVCFQMGQLVPLQHGGGVLHGGGLYKLNPVDDP